MTVTYDAPTYVVLAPPTNVIVLHAGFDWDTSHNRWQTRTLAIAGKLESYMDAIAWQQYQADKAKAKILQALSAQATSNADIPLPQAVKDLSQDYLPYQKVGILFCAHQDNVLNGDDPGLGKTVEAIGTLNLLQARQGLMQVLVVCPGRLKGNWYNELMKWLVKNYGVHICTGTSKPDTAAIQIINYQLLTKWESEIKTRAWDLLIVDEAHKIKKPSALRSKMILGAKSRSGTVAVSPIEAKRKQYLTGTPMPNGRPRELWPLIHSLDPVTFHDFKAYALQYCNAYISQKTKKLCFPPGELAASNLDELQALLRSTIMLRREKHEVLKDLPPKRRQVIELPPDGCEEVILEELRAFDTYKVELDKMRDAVTAAKLANNSEEYKKAVRQLRAGQTYAFSQIAKMRVKTALAKMPMVLSHLDELVSEGVKVAVFAHHHDVINPIKDHFGKKAATLTGSVNNKVFDQEKDRFQTDPNTPVALCSITLAEGYTITAASYVVFVEGDWVPGVLTQAEDRCHRIGLVNPLLIQHLVLEGSLDATMMKRVIAKQNNNDQTFNKQPVQEEELTYA